MRNIKLFENKKIRSQWNADQEKWHFSIVDVIGVLTVSSNPGEKKSKKLSAINSD